jgi:hypothetical protein
MHIHMRFQGTVDFMAVEVAGGKFLFLKDEVGPRDEDLFRPETPEPEPEPKPEPEPEPENTQPSPENRVDNDARSEIPAFIHVPNHDVESYWWIAISKMFHNKVYKEGSSPPEGGISTKQLEKMKELFPEYETFAAHRHVFLRSGHEYMCNMATLHNCWKDITDILASIRANLCELYEIWEMHLLGREPKLNPVAYSRLPFTRIKKKFDACIEAGKGMKLKGFKTGRQHSVIAPPAKTSSKRGSSSIAPDESVPRKRTR